MFPIFTLKIEDVYMIIVKNIYIIKIKIILSSTTLDSALSALFFFFLNSLLFIFTMGL